MSQAGAAEGNAQSLLNSPHSLVVGNPSGDVTLVEFFDYNCGYCKKALARCPTLMKSDPKLRVVLKDFPVLGPDSVEASRVGLAVKNQLQGEKLLDYHVQAHGQPRPRERREGAMAVARTWASTWLACRRTWTGAEVRAAIEENVGLGDKLGLTGTPAFIVGEKSSRAPSASIR